MRMFNMNNGNNNNPINTEPNTEVKDDNQQDNNLLKGVTTLLNDVGDNIQKAYEGNKPFIKKCADKVEEIIEETAKTINETVINGVKYLIDTNDKHGRIKLLNQALKEKNNDLVRALLETKAFDVKETILNDKPLVVAVKAGNIQGIKLLMKHGVKCDKEVFAALNNPNVDKKIVELFAEYMLKEDVALKAAKVKIPAPISKEEKPTVELNKEEPAIKKEEIKKEKPVVKKKEEEPEVEEEEPVVEEKEEDKKEQEPTVELNKEGPEVKKEEEALLEQNRLGNKDGEDYQLPSFPGDNKDGELVPKELEQQMDTDHNSPNSDDV